MWRVCFLAILLVAGRPEAGLAEVRISVDVFAQEMTVFVDGTLQHTWPVSTGRDGYATPIGSFRPFRLEADHRSREWDDAPMPYSIFFTERGHAIHGTGSVSRLGSPVSHGCIRLSVANAGTLFALVQEHGLANTDVEISGPGWSDKPYEAFATIGDDPSRLNYDSFMQLFGQ